jgi:ATP-dependent RNA helicase SUPV3L1/SUV3
LTASSPPLPRARRSKGVTAVLGPTNTGKTHLAIERMLGHESGMIGLPLRLLAREVYGRVVERVGAEAVALVTGEEKIKPPRPRYWISTVEAMPRDVDVSFLAVDEIQLASDPDRGHVFTDRLLNARGRHETMLIGSGVVRGLIEKLIPGAGVVTRPRLSKLCFSGEKKITRLPRRSAIVAFSAEEVYAIAELIRRQKGAAAVVLGALSPRTRNAQVALYQSGDVDHIVATDAIGMGLNLDVDHVAFAADRKFDGFRFRRLTAAEMGQIAGRAGRHLRDGTFGSTGRCPSFDADLIEALEEHRFDAVELAQWRNADLDFSGLRELEASLSLVPREPGLTRAPIAEDQAALEVAMREAGVRDVARKPEAVARLWEVCQVPDYRRVASHAHADLVVGLYLDLMRKGRIPDDWFARQIALVDRTDGDIDTLSARIAQVRTWTFVANRPDWLRDPEHWQGIARRVEDSLSDALHERLAQRFVDRRTSLLMRRLRENAMLEAEIVPSGDVFVEGQHVGHLHGFRFSLDPSAVGPEAKALRGAATRALAAEFEARAERFSAAVDESLALANDGSVRWLGEVVGKLSAGDRLTEPRIRLLADDQLSAAAREKVEKRLSTWIAAHVRKHLGPLFALEEAPEVTGVARGIAYQAAEALGVLERGRVAEEMRQIDPEARGKLRALGLRFGAYHIYVPALMKPAPRTLAAQLWALRHGGPDLAGLDDIAHLAASGRTSIPADPAIDKGLYRAAGFRVCGTRAVRVDILERLADLIRPAIAYRPGVTQGDPPAGAADGDGFVVSVQMTSLVGCSGEDFASILRSLGYASTMRPGPAVTAPTPAAPAPAPDMSPGADTIVGVGPTDGDSDPDAAGIHETQALAAASDAALEAGEPRTEPVAEPTAPAPDTADTAGEAEAAGTQGAAPEMIEIWHPRRHQKRPHGDRRPARDGQRPDRPARSGQDRPAQDRPAQDRAAQDRAPQDRPAQDSPREARGERRDGGPQKPRSGEGGGGPGANRSGKAGGKPGGRPERRFDRRDEREDRNRQDKGGGGPRVFGDRPDRRPDRPVDPDSPFAKLAALKAQLEKK